MGWADGTLRAIEPRPDKALKPCPFCGSSAEIEPWHGGPPTKVLISCGDEYCQVRPSVAADTRRQAVRIWNRRKEGV
jgi:hypothetical protein